MMSPCLSTGVEVLAEERQEHTRTGREQPASVAEVVLFDPDADRGIRIRDSLGGAFRVCRAKTLDDVARHCHAGSPSLILLSLGVAAGPDGGRVDAPVLDFLRTFGRHLPILVYADTSHLPISVYCQPLAAGARQVLNEGSPAFLDELTETMSRLVEDARAHAREQQQLGTLFSSHYGLFGCSAGMEDVYRRAIKAAHFSDLPVLLLGETGTGKQRVAEAIHALDPRRKDKPLVTINCSALSKTLAESELFGHSRGAFSGAANERKGLFRAANGGTLMLDEIGELDAELQPKLLRVLQERRLLPVGEDYEHPVDVRIIAATHRSLETMVAEGKFREDLYQRLNVFRIHLPPLRARREDIGVQARHFLAHYQEGQAGPALEFGPRVLEALCALPWEGNTRQLENFVREALAQKGSGGGTSLEMEDLPRWVFERLAQAPPDVPVAAPAHPEVDFLLERACSDRLSFSQAIEDYERRLLERVLKLTGGNRTHAATRLGLTPRTIFAKIKKYQLE